MAIIKRKSSLKKGLIKRIGPKQKGWRKYRGQRAQEDQDEDGLLHCQDYLVDLPRCNIARLPSDMDLHHIKGREARPDLYFDNKNNIWLTRECHDKVHA